MLYSTTPPAQKRAAFRGELASGRLLRFPGAFNPLSAKLIQEKGFDGVYISGAVIAADLGLPDIGLTTLTEVAGRGAQIARMTDRPSLIDADTGFGEPMNVARTVQTLEDAGVAGLHIEDQVNPKRCGHLDGKAVVDSDTAIKRIKAAVDARRDPNLLIMARTDAAATQGFDAAVERAQRFAEAGADILFVEAVTTADEVRALPGRLATPQLVNLVIGGKTPIVGADELKALGYGFVLYANAALQGAVAGMQRVLGALQQAGRVDEDPTLVVPFAERQRLVDKARWDELEGRYTP
jgi:2-methylisocitrate lyase-like PEP mutase family enzyme